MKYVLITPARNEERNIAGTLQSVVSQIARPELWVIVDDGSSDRTAEIVSGFANEHPWIVLVRRGPRADRSFAGKAHAVNAGLERLQKIEFEVMGIMDGDVSFGPDYLGFIVEKFALDPNLGVAGTPFTEDGYDTARDSFEGENHVAGACQMFRYRCFQDIGGYVANKAGGVDWIAVTTARMKGWTTRSFPDKRLHHHRPMGTAERGALSALFSYGEKDYYLGGSPIWQIFRVSYRTLKRPYLVGGLALFAGYTWAAIRRTKRPVSPELMRFHRKEQMRKLGGIFRSLLRLQKVDNFSLKPKQST